MPDRRHILVHTLSVPLLGSGLGCTGVQVRPGDADTGGRVLRTRLERVDASYRRAPAGPGEPPWPALPDPAELSIHVLPGRLAGPEPVRVHRIRLKRAHAALEAGTQDGFALDLSALERLVADRAAPVAPARPGDRLQPVPEGLRIARLWLSVGDPFYYPHFEREAGFMTADGTRFGLIYADRAGGLDALIQADDGPFEHRLTLPGAGLHWMVIRPAGPRAWQVELGRPEGPVVTYVRLSR